MKKIQAAEEGERADDNERADDEAQRGRRAGAGLELLARHAHEERAEHEADDLRTDVLHLGGAVQATGARGVVGFFIGILIGIACLKRGFTLRRSYEVSVSEGSVQRP